MHSDKASTFASAEQFFLAHVTHSLMPWLRRWEEAYNKAFFLKNPNVYVKHNVNELLRGDAAQRADFYMKALGGARGETAYMTRNEVRALEDLDPIENGDKLLIPTIQPPVDAGADPNASAMPGGDARLSNEGLKSKLRELIAAL